MDTPNCIALFALIAALISALIAFKALKAAESQLNIQQEHNKKSLKPLAIIDLGDYENKLYAKIVNCGLGPLIIEEVIVKKNNITRNEILSFLPNLPSGKEYNDFTQEFEGKIITPNNSIFLFDIDFDRITESELKKSFRKELSKIDVTVKFKSIYDEKDEVNREFTWFNRQHV